MPDGVLCGEDHHLEGKDKFKYYSSPACKYFLEDSMNDVYGIAENSKKRAQETLDYMKRKRDRLVSKIEEIKKEIADIDRFLNTEEKVIYP